MMVRVTPEMTAHAETRGAAGNANARAAGWSRVSDERGRRDNIAGRLGEIAVAKALHRLDEYMTTPEHYGPGADVGADLQVKTSTRPEARKNLNRNRDVRCYLQADPPVTLVICWLRDTEPEWVDKWPHTVEVLGWCRPSELIDLVATDYDGDPTGPRAFYSVGSYLGNDGVTYRETHDHVLRPGLPDWAYKARVRT